MAQSGVKPFNTFTRGFNTEANPLVFPEDFSVDELNMTVQADGGRRRRLGLDYETNYTLSASTDASILDQGSVSSFVWHSPNNLGDLSILVLQLGRTLHFYKVVKEKTSSNKYASTIDLSQYKISGADDIAKQRLDFASGLGVLTVASGSMDPIYVQFDSDTETFSATAITIEVRDIAGVDDGFDIDEYVAAGSRTNLKDYNLLNQGWDESRIDSVISGGGVSPGSLPPNSGVWWLAKGSTGTFSNALFDQQVAGTGLAPRGHYIVDAFNIDRSTVADPDTTEDVSGIAIETTTERPTTVAFLAGRVWYSGATLPNNPNRVYFSQILTSLDNIGRCYTNGDPTAEINSDLLDTDGGYINLPEASRILKLVNFSSTMLVFAENGIWQIRGGENGFTPSSFITSRINDVGVVGRDSVVEIEGGLLYWSDGGIYSVGVDTVTGELQITNATEESIQTFYSAITRVNRKNAFGIYDNTSKKALWFYNSLATNTEFTNKNKFNACLVFDAKANGFFKYSLDTDNNIFVACPFVTNDVYIETRREQVINSRTDDNVTDSTGDLVYVNSEYSKAPQYKLQLVVLVKSSGSYQVTVGSFKNSIFKDWEIALGNSAVDYSSYVLGPYSTVGNWLSNKYPAYIWFASEKSETGYVTDSAGELVLENPTQINYRARFDWSDNSASNKWTDLYTNGYRFEDSYIPSPSGDDFETGQTVVITKNRVNGSGRAIQLYLESSTGKEMHLYGWATQATDNQTP